MNWITAKANGKTGELMIYGDISDVKWWDEDVTPQEVDKAIKELKDCTDITVRVNSYGGSVFAGLAIISMIRNIKAKTTAIIEGIGASMGSVIPLACDKVMMSENAMMMIHKPLMCAGGNANVLRKKADLLDKCEAQLIEIYMKRYKGTMEDLQNKMSNETWFTANEALELGLIDEINAPIEMAASAKGFMFNKLEIEKSSGIYAKLQQKGAIPKNMEIKEKLKALGCEIVEADTLDSVLNKLPAVLDKLEKQSEINLTVVDNEDGSKTVKNGEIEVAKVEAKVTETVKEVTVLKADEATQAKADAFDKIKSERIENALKSGVKALGDKFNNDLWNKTLDGFTVEEIDAMSSQWIEQAKEVFNAGVHRTQVQATNNVSKETNIEDYKI